MPQGRKRRADDGEKRMKKECTEQDLQRLVQDAKLAFEDVTLTELDEDSSRYWQDDGLMVDYELRNGQVGCVLRRQIFAEGKVWAADDDSTSGRQRPAGRPDDPAGARALPRGYEPRFSDGCVQPPLF